jgi:alkylhydroperoxidase/carboxymuconolactone decarboxylase family protein YurZ
MHRDREALYKIFYKEEAPMFTYPFTNEIGAGDIPGEVQQAIWREINFRLGDGEKQSPLSRLEKSLVLIRIAACQLNAMRTYQYALEALQAGGTLDQVAEAAVSVTMVGMLRWKMSAMDALSCAEAWADQHHLPPRTARAAEEGMEERVHEERGYVRKSLNREFPDMWERLSEVAPEVLDGYMKMRMGIVHSCGTIPKHIKELTIVGSDICQGNAWGAGMHAGQAIRDGARIAQVVDTVALAMMEIGQSAYRIGGLDAIKAAREIDTF